MSNCRVTDCDAPTQTFICNLHLGEIRKALRALPELLDELGVTIARQDKGGGASVYAARVRGDVGDWRDKRSDFALVATPWPFSWDAADVRDATQETMRTWAHHIAESRGLFELPARASVAGKPCEWICTHPRCDTHRRLRVLHELAVEAKVDPRGFLLGVSKSIAMDEAAGDMHDEITYLPGYVRRAIDRQEADVFAGRCSATSVYTHVEDDGTVIPEISQCGTDLFARPGDDEVRCSECGKTYPMTGRREHLIESAEQELARPQAIANALTEWEAPVNATTIRKWIQRDSQVTPTPHGPRCEDDECAHGTCIAMRRELEPPRIWVRGYDADGNALYRVGDVRARVQWSESRGGRRRAGSSGACA